MTDDTPDPGLRPDQAVPQSLRLFTHDIRAAMSDILGGLRLMDADRLDPETRAQLERVRIAGETLAELVDAALAEASGEGAAPPDGRGVSLSGVLAATEMRWTGSAQEAGGAFRITRGAGLPERLAVPRVALDRILGNLIGNALSHGAGGTAELSVLPSDERGIIFRVSDEGPGFSAAALARLAGPAGGMGGEEAPTGQSGLGLHIARNLAAEIGGRIDIANRVPRGATVTLHLPADRLVPVAEDAAAPDLSGLSVLLAEDNETNRMIACRILTHMGARVEVAADGVEALNMIDGAAFDIALVDIEMPRMSGIEVMQAVRARTDERRSLPLVALTAYVLLDNREAIYAAGADGIIAKPIRSGPEFGRAVLRHAGRGGDGGQAPAAAARDDTAQAARMDTDRLDRLLAHAGTDGAAELLARMAEDLSDVRARLAAAVEARDGAVIRAQTHVLVSLAGAAGADRLRHMAEALNIAARRGRMADVPAIWAPCDADLAALVSLIDTRRAAAGA